MSEDKKTILVVDDEQVVLNLFENALKKHEYELTVLCDSTEAANVLQSKKIDLLITDICMPDIDGLKLASDAMQRDPELKVIVMTAYGTNERLLKCIDMDCYGYVDKPFNWDYMKTLIAKALG